MFPRRLFSNIPHAVPILCLCGLSLVYWSQVLFTGQVLLPGAMLSGFSPFGANAQAPWNILQWDALGQYYPWRLFAARQLHLGLIPLWNPHQFAGAPFLANGQSAIFYPLNLPFWIMDVASAFGVSALLHTLLASISTYFLAQRWQLSRAASLVTAIAFSFCGYLAAWVMLPTLANTASWLPLLVLCLEYGTVPPADSTPRSLPVAALPLGITLCCALLAGHAQIFFYLLVALGLRALTLPQRGRAFGILCTAGAFCLALGALQLLPTLELARLSHRAGQHATSGGWHEIAIRALLPGDVLSLFIPNWPMTWGSLNENFGYVGIVTPLLVLLSVSKGIKLLLASRSFQPGNQDTVAAKEQTANSPLAHPLLYAGLLAVFGLPYATASPLAQLFYFTVPGLAQMGGVGRSLILWSFGLGLCAGYGVDVLRSWSKSDLVPVLAVLLVAGELFAGGWTLHSGAPRATVYPDTQVTHWLQEHTRDGSRILCLTPRHNWRPTEAFSGATRTHPPGVLPPNGAIVYGLHDVNGYDSLAPKAYRDFVAQGEGDDVAPAFNGNMILLNNINSPSLDALNVRYIISAEPLNLSTIQPVLQADGCFVYARHINAVPQVDGSHFSPGWRNGQYQPESFRFGTFLSLCTLAVITMITMSYLRVMRHKRVKYGICTQQGGFS